MNLTKSSNPVFGKQVFNQTYSGTNEGVMTINGTVNKTGLMLAIVIFAALFTWNKFFGAYNPSIPEAAFSSVKLWMILGGIGGFITAFGHDFQATKCSCFRPYLCCFRRTFPGGISAFFEAMYPGLVMRAVAAYFRGFPDYAFFVPFRNNQGNR